MECQRHITPPSQPKKQSILNTLNYRVFSIYDQDSVQSELNKLKRTRFDKIYTTVQVKEVIQKLRRKKASVQTELLQRTEHKKKTPIIFLPHIQGIIGKSGKVLNKHRIKTIYKPPIKIRQYLDNTKYKRPLLNVRDLYNPLLL